MRLWGKDEERGALLGAIGAIVLFTFVFPDPDVDLGVVFPGNPPYGLLWKFLNPFYWTKTLYPMIVFTEWAGVTLFEWWLLKRNRGLVKLQIFSVAFLLMLHATQDVTVIMFAPLVVLFPGFILLGILQKIPFPGTAEWQCAFHGTGTDANAYLYPCLSNSTHFLTWNHIYWMTYPIIVLSFIIPLVLYYKRGKVASGRWGSIRSKLQYYLSWGLWKEDVERGGEETEYRMTPTIRKQTSPSPTKSWSLLDVVLLLAIGATAHDFASYYGLHVEPFHAFYYTLPAIALLVLMKWRRWKK